VSREESALRATRGDGTIVFYAPVTTGSQHDRCRRRLQGRRRRFASGVSLQPDLFWDAKPKTGSDDQSRPNNPVGVV